LPIYEAAVFFKDFFKETKAVFGGKNKN
jgi:hypothetical protein